MIFVTVGTHEQPFNRLIEYVDNMKIDRIIDEEIIIQTGFSTYKPKGCSWQRLYSYQQMVKLINEARIVITHGGPSSFLMPLQISKIPIVVPRLEKYGEHVNNHQLDFLKTVNKQCGNLIVVEDIDILGDVIQDYDKIVAGMKADILSNNDIFCERFEKLADELVGEKR